jgi:putative ABC transport system substrate-binding protein
VGVLFHDRTAEAEAPWQEFVAELDRRGYIEGRTIVFEKRHGDQFRSDLLEARASELVAARVDVIYVYAGTPAALAAKRATTVIPIVFYSSGDPVGLKLVDSLARPGGNLTGSSNQNNDIFPKSLQFFLEAVPSLERITCVQPTGTRKLPWFESELAAATAAARKLRISFAYEDVASVAEIESFVQRFGSRRAGVFVEDHPLFRGSLAAIASTCLRLKALYSPISDVAPRYKVAAPLKPVIRLVVASRVMPML